MNKIISFFTAVVFSVMGFFGIPYDAPDLEATQKAPVALSREQEALFTDIFETETAYLASMQLSNGALPMTRAENGELRMNPYFADIAALALLDDAEKYADNVVKYMDWHFAHLNTAKEDFNGLDGTIYDYVITVKNGEIVSEAVSQPEDADPYDTTDSYAATFLTVVYKYLCKTGDSDYLVAHARDLERITGVIFSNLQNGLTYAKPNHRIKYLMDNCEVYEGALAAAGIFERITDCEKIEYAALRDDCTKLASALKEKSIPAKIFSWDLYYPQATSQLFPIICGVIEPNTQRAQSLYGKFCESYNWQNFEYPDDFYWGANAYAAAIMGDAERVTEYMTNYAELTDDHAWPLYNADIARASMAACVMLGR